MKSQCALYPGFCYNRVFIILHRPDIACHQFIEDIAYFFPNVTCAETKIEPVLVDDLMFFISQYLKPFLLMSVIRPAESSATIITPATSRYFCALVLSA